MSRQRSTGSQPVPPALGMLAVLLLAAMACDRKDRSVSPQRASRGKLTVQVSRGSEAMVPVLLEDAEEAFRRLARWFGHDGDVPFSTTVYWVDRATWEGPRSAGAVGLGLPYGMPFAVPDQHIVVLPAADQEQQPFIDAIVEAAPARPPSPDPRARNTGYYRAILVHELFHIFWSEAGYPREPVWLREGMAQVAVLRARKWPRFASTATEWVALNRELYRRPRVAMAVTSLDEASRKYKEITPLNYSWFLGGLFAVFEDLDDRCGHALVTRALSGLPKGLGRDRWISAGAALEALDTACDQTGNPSWRADLAPADE